MRKIICIGREFGSGGHLVAKKFAEQTGIVYYDKKLFEYAVTQIGIQREILEKAEEKKANALLQPIYYEGELKKYYGKNANDILFEAQKEMILKIASEQDCVIVGRCADFILKSETDFAVKSVFFNAPLEYRIRRTMELDGLKLSDCGTKVHKMDKNRSAYYNYYTERDWGKPDNYDICINTAYNAEEYILNILECIYKNMGTIPNSKKNF